MADTPPRTRRQSEAVSDEPATVDDLIARYVQEDPNGMGRHRARVVVDDHTWAPVWVLAGYLRYGGTPEQAAADYGLPEDAVAAALAYYDRHRAVIDAWLLLNEQSGT
jgi:hypothetical protein